MTLPKALVVDDIAPYLNNMTALTRHVPAVFKPQTEGDVRLLIEYANRNGVKLYPFGRGKNWGIGSKLPVKDGTSLVDLSLMNRVFQQGYRFGETTQRREGLAGRHRSDGAHADEILVVGLQRDERIGLRQRLGEDRMRFGRLLCAESDQS